MLKGCDMACFVKNCGYGDVAESIRVTPGHYFTKQICASHQANWESFDRTGYSSQDILTRAESLMRWEKYNRRLTSPASCAAKRPEKPRLYLVRQG